MKRLGTALFLALAAAAFAQEKSAFEVASVKPAAPLDNAKILAAMKAGEQIPLGPHAGINRAEYLYMSLKSLIVYAWQVKPYQVSGPDWLDQQRFDIVAKYPAGATKADAPSMLQSLLEERFRLQVHKSTEERPVFALVSGKGAPKLKPSAGKPAPLDANAPLKPGERMIDGPDGKPMLVRIDSSTGNAIVDMGEQGRMTYKIDRAATPPVIHIEFGMVTIPGFAAMMTQILTQVAGGASRQIVDMTHIQGNYEASFDLSIEDMLAMVRNAGIDLPVSPTGDSTAANSLSEAVRSLGLKLESRKATVELLIVDHAEKKPIEN
jgi:uncharacterized protein (TIGR03435 family)